MSLRLPSPCFWRRDRDRYDASSLSIPLSRDDSDVETPRSWVPSQLGSLAAGTVKKLNKDSYMSNFPIDHLAAAPPLESRQSIFDIQDATILGRNRPIAVFAKTLPSPNCRPRRFLVTNHREMH